MIRLNWRQLKTRNSLDLPILEVKTGFYSKKAFELFTNVLNSEKTYEFMASPVYGLRVKIVELLSTAVHLKDSPSIYAIPDEVGETTIFLKSFYASFPNLPSIGSVKLYIKEVIDANITNDLNYTEEDRELIRLKYWFDSGVAKPKSEDYEDLIGIPFNAFESKVAENLIDEYFKYRSEFWHGDWTIKNSEIVNCDNLMFKQLIAYKKLKDMLK